MSISKSILICLISLKFGKEENIIILIYFEKIDFFEIELYQIEFYSSIMEEKNKISFFPINFFIKKIEILHF